jgi:hypothetical protein
MFLESRKCVQIIQSLLCVLFLTSSITLFSQTNYTPLGLKDYEILDRLEIKTRNENLSFSTVKPYMRRANVRSVEAIDSMLQLNPDYANITEIDKYNMQNLLMNNSEWSKPRDYYKSSKPVLNALYKTKGNLLEVNNPDLFLAINPILYLTAGKENGNDKMLFQNTRGLSARGMISKRVGFNIIFTENQERTPRFVNRWIQAHTAVPGVGNYKNRKYSNERIVDYFDARGSVSWNVAKYIDMQFGFDKNFIGAGYRSLFLSDFSNSATFLKINTRIWKFNYENLFFELYTPHGLGGDDLFPRKYARMNHLSINATKWLNVGVFESVVFGRENHFDFQYLIPVMFIRPAESNLGSADNSMVGFDAKANVAGKFQFYGQYFLDELIVKELVNNRGWWGNKQGYQLGVKYIDAFGLKNVDLQLETNRMRPYTYSHRDSISNYTHYNQPLAHPLGANFQEFIAIAKAQPFKKVYLQGKLIHYYQGLDSAGVNFGSNPFLSYNTRPRNYGFKVGDGTKATCNILSMVASYELTQNMFIDLTGFFRAYKIKGLETEKTTTASISFRWNIGRREFIF